MKTKLRVLVACEFSGIVRDAFIALGHAAVSCDLLPSEQPGPHVQGDVRRLLKRNQWDLMIAHPPCQYLTNAGVRWLYHNGTGTARDPARWRAMRLAAAFMSDLLDAPVPHIAVENPIMHRYGLALVGRPCDQIIQPWQFGHGETKATCLWLKGLPPLAHTRVRSERVPRVHFASPGPERWKERSRTLPGIARAMAKQWGEFV